MAANPSGEEKSSAQSRGVTPARIAVIAVLAVAVIALAFVIFSGGSEHKYNLLFQNASQLVPDNQVLIGGQPVGSVESIELTDDNLAKVVVSVEQELHEGTTATIRATSLSGVANHYVSISPGPNSNPALRRRRHARPCLDHDADRHRPVLQHLPRPGAARPRPVHQGQRRNLCRRRQGRQQDLQIPRRRLQPRRRLRPRRSTPTNISSPASWSARAGSAPPSPNAAHELSSAIANANTAFGAIASQNAALGRSLQLLPPTFRQANTTFVNLRAALDDVEPLIDTTSTATKDLAPFLAELRPVLSKSVPVFKNLAPHRATARASPTTPPNCSPRCRRCSSRASRAFPHSEAAILAFQPNLNFFRAYTPDFFNGFAKLGQVTAPYDANGHYVRVSFSDLNIFKFNAESGATLEPIAPSEQYDAFGASAGIKRRCPGGASQPAADGSSPFVEPPFTGSGVTTSDCNPDDSPPGP